jgi:hypothetical protein
VTAIRDTVRTTPGVLGLHDLRTRRMAQKILIDAHVQVDGHISVSEGHRIGDEVRNRVLLAHDDVLDMLVHVDPEDDKRAEGATAPPDRQALLDHLGTLLGNDEMLALQKVQLHYLGGGVEAEVFVGVGVIRDPQRLARLERILTEHIGNDPYFRRISINCTIAP